VIDRLPHVREPSSGEPDVCVHCLEEWVDLLTLYERDECSVRLRAEVERLRVDVATFTEDFIRVTSEACAPDEVHCSCVPHLRAEIKRLRAEIERLRGEAERERAAVVAWLRYEAELRTGTNTGTALRVSGGLSGAADDIESGEHRRQETE
jgi:uncharacterized small protein (DUF1192 family)